MDVRVLEAGAEQRALEVDDSGAVAERAPSCDFGHDRGDAAGGDRDGVAVDRETGAGEHSAPGEDQVGSRHVALASSLNGSDVADTNRVSVDVSTLLTTVMTDSLH